MSDICEKCKEEVEVTAPSDAGMLCLNCYEEKIAVEAIRIIKELKEWVEDGLPPDWLKDRKGIPRIGHTCKDADKMIEKLRDYFEVKK